jgi:phenylpropionate dioxygenase-like ring-hydroxylating dioxygenase large terminal subunit
MFTAACPHLGADLAMGHVDGDALVCPFHGWKFDTDGINVEIPYEDRPNRGQRCHQWQLTEVANMILVWYDGAGRPPQWQPPAVPEAADTSYHGIDAEFTETWARTRLEPVMLFENFADFAHFKYVHGHSKEAEIADLSFDGPFMNTKLINYYGSGRPGKYTGEQGYIVGDNFLDAWAVGVVIARHTTARQMMSTTGLLPTDPGVCTVRMQVFVQKEHADEAPETDIVQKLVRSQFKQQELDLNILARAEYRRRPPFTKKEVRGFLAIRDWVRQFYPEAGPDAS